jgi:preprotein translocase subunit SecF
VSSWKYGLATIIALAHDVLIPLGVFVFLGHFKGFEIDLLFVTGLLAILGYSVHDTIVVFDRVRENLQL